MTGKEIFEMGRQYMMTTTVAPPYFIPRSGLGSRVKGDWVERGLTDYWVLDFNCSVACNALGHCNPAIRQAIVGAQDTGLGHIPANDWYHEDAVVLAERLCKLAPINSSDRKVFFCNSGAEAVESAIKVALAYRHRRGEKHSRDRFLAFDGSFNGRTFGSLSLNRSKPYHVQGFFSDGDSASAGQHVHYRAVPVSFLDFPEAGDVDGLARFEFFTNIMELDDVNALVFELVQGEGGIRVADVKSVQRLVARCREHGVLVVVDEVQTGFYRTGTLFACGQYGIEPDIICLAKALGGTMPLGAIVARADLDFSRLGQHSNTFGGGPTACAASLAFLSELEKLDFIALLARADRLAQFAPKGLGLMRRVDFTTPEARDEAVIRAMEEGVWVIGAGRSAIRLMPPLNIAEDDLDDGIVRLARAFHDRLS